MLMQQSSHHRQLGWWKQKYKKQGKTGQVQVKIINYKARKPHWHSYMDLPIFYSELKQEMLTEWNANSASTKGMAMNP